MLSEGNNPTLYAMVYDGTCDINSLKQISDLNSLFLIDDFVAEKGNKRIHVFFR